MGINEDIAKRNAERIKDMRLDDLRRHAEDLEAIAYDDEELVIIDDLKEIPRLAKHKIGFNLIVVCMAGNIQFDVSGTPVSMKANQLAICQCHAVLSNFTVSTDFECKALCISDRLLHSVLSAQMAVWDTLRYRQRCHVLDVDTERIGIYNELRYYWASEGSFKREILASLLRVAFLELCQMLMKVEEVQAEDILDSTSRMDMLFQQFLANIARRHVKKRSVADYAEELCITPKYLSTVCRMVSGKSPIEWIAEYVVEDIAYYLKNSSLTASQIAAELGFPNASFFGKYVREHLGTSPNEYRRRQLADTL